MRTELRFLRSLVFGVVLTLGALLASAQAFAGTVTVSWTAPTSCTDNSFVINCPTTGYEIWMGTSLTGTAYSKRAEVPSATATSIQLLNVSAGSKCFYMKTLSGTLTSAESNRLCVTVPASEPNAPVISVTIAVP